VVDAGLRQIPARREPGLARSDDRDVAFLHLGRNLKEDCEKGMGWAVWRPRSVL
jgi:hypothetical protein